MNFLITGGCGFLGSNLARHALENQHDVWLFDNLSRVGSQRNLAFLQQHGSFEMVRADIRSLADVEEAVRQSRPDAVFHVCGQVAMTTSINDPRADFEINVVGGHNVLEAVRRHAPNAAVLFSSTNKVYGDLETVAFEETPTRYVARDFPLGFDEKVPLEFCSPYGCSKGAIDQYMLDYARIYGLKTVVFRHSSICGQRQFSTFDQGWVGWFVQQALAQKAAAHDSQPVAPFSVAGNGKQVRDVLFADDLVCCYFAALARIDEAAGHAFNIGGGPQNSLSLLELFAMLERELDVKLQFDCLAPRQSDQKVFIANTQKAKQLFDWQPRLGKDEGLSQLISWVTGI